MSSFAGKSAAEVLATPVQFAKGVGPGRAELLARLELFVVRDLLFYFPRAYEDFSEQKSVDQLVQGEAAAVCGVVEEIDLRNTGVGRSLLGVLIRQDRQYLRALWFNQPYLRERFALGQRVIFSGQAKLAGLRWEMHHPKIDWLADDEAPPRGQVLPVYSLTEGLSQAAMRRIIRGIVEHYGTVLEEVFPETFLAEHQLLPLSQALPWIHNAPDRERLAEAQRRFVYQELFVLQVALALRKSAIGHSQKAAPLAASAKIDARIHRLFPFELTTDQRQAMAEVAADMGRSVPMNRLLQRSNKLDIAFWQDLRDPGQPKFVDYEVPEERAAEHEWPILTPAGIEPAPNPERELHRSR